MHWHFTQGSSHAVRYSFEAGKHQKGSYVYVADSWENKCLSKELAWLSHEII